jgi:hypothetical protein
LFGWQPFAAEPSGAQYPERQLRTQCPVLQSPDVVVSPLHGTPHAPQFALSARLLHLPLQFVKPELQPSAQPASTHVSVPWGSVDVHAALQDPQFEVSFFKSLQWPVQLVKPALHMIPHEVPLHVGMPWSGVGHAVQLEPHEAGESLLSHVPPQSCV